MSDFLEVYHVLKRFLIFTDNHLLLSFYGLLLCISLTVPCCWVIISGCFDNLVAVFGYYIVTDFLPVMFVFSTVFVG